MALNEALRAALRALSFPDVDLPQNYRRVRALQDAAPMLRAHIVQNAREAQIAGVPVRIYEPEPDARRPGALLFFHGGGWVTGSLVSYHAACGHLCEHTGRPVCSVGYRLAPEHRFPDGLSDCHAVLQAVLAGDPTFPYDGPLTLMGDSAGANLAAASLLMCMERGERLPDAQILFYPVVQTDFTDGSPFPSVRENGQDYLLTSRMMREYLALYVRGEVDARNPFLAPLYAPSLAGLPRALVVTAQYDPLRDEGEAFAARLEREGVPTSHVRVEGALHGFFSLPPRFAHAARALELIRDFLDGHPLPPDDAR